MSLAGRGIIAAVSTGTFAFQKMKRGPSSAVQIGFLLLSTAVQFLDVLYCALLHHCLRFLYVDGSTSTRRKEPACASRASAEQWSHERDLAATVTPGENPVIVGSIWRLSRPLQQG